MVSGGAETAVVDFSFKMSSTSQKMPLSWQSADLGLESSFGPYFLMTACIE